MAPWALKMPFYKEMFGSRLKVSWCKLHISAYCVTQKDLSHSAICNCLRVSRTDAYYVFLLVENYIALQKNENIYCVLGGWKGGYSSPIPHPFHHNNPLLPPMFLPEKSPYPTYLTPIPHLPDPHTPHFLPEKSLYPTYLNPIPHLPHPQYPAYPFHPHINGAG